MNHIFLLSFLIVPILGWAQQIDSTAIRQVDSLIQVSRDLTAKKAFDHALEVNAAAEKIALSRAPGMGRESAAYGSCCFNRGRVLHIIRDYPEAEKWYLESKAIWEKALGKDHPDYASSLNSLAIVYKKMGQYEKAETLYLEAKAIREKALGKDHPDYASSLNNLALLYSDMGQYDKAEPLFLEAKAIWEKSLGKDHSDYAKSLNNLAILYRDMGQYENAEPLFLEAKAIWEKVLGKDHPHYASSLNNLAILYYDMGQYEKTETLYLEAKAIWEKVLGKDHPHYASSLNNLAMLYANMGQYEKAETLYLEAKAILENALGKDHPQYASSLQNLAVLYSEMGQYEKIETLYLEAKAIREKALGKDHPHYSSSLQNLASLYRFMGQYEKAEPLFLEAKAILEKVLEKDHPDYASSLNDLALLYSDMGQYEKAETLYLEAKAILENALGKDHPQYASSLNNLATLYYDMGQYEKAEPFYLEAKVIREKALGKDHPDYAGSLNNLAMLYTNMGQYEKAEPLFLEAKAILEKALGKEHPEYAKNLNNLAMLYTSMGQYEKAEPLFLEAKALFNKALGKEHPEHAKNLNNLAMLYTNMGQYEKAEPLFNELSTLNKQLITKAVHHLSERELGNYLNTFSHSQTRTLSFTQTTGSKKTASTCYDNSLFYKGFLLQSTRRIKQLALSDEGAAEKYIRLKDYQRRLATQYALPIAERDSALVARLESQANDIEKDLARTVAGYDEARRPVQWQEVQAALQPGEAVMEFVHYRYYDKKATDSMMYAALVLHPGNSMPSFIPLFEEGALDSLLSPHSERRADYVNNLYTIADRGVRPIEKPQKTLYELIWQPLEKELASVNTIYYSPSGLLHRLNLGAIPVSDEETLTDRYRLTGMTSTRQLVVKAEVKIVEQNACLFGGVQYEMDSMAIAAANQELEADLLATRGEVSFSYADSTLRGGAWNYLKWTDKEVDKIHTTLSEAGFQIDTRKAYAATEESFKAIGAGGPSPRILHVATHGFFFSDPETSPSSLLSGGERVPVFKLSDHPMIRSGLILAGGNHAWQTGKPLQPDMEDGILTAYEISQMNLSNTELVVLSACETGLGDIQGNEGVYGLQRAFKIAGAKYLIMSLWQVPDKETAFFMELFYKNLFGMDMNIPGAFRATQDELRENPFVSPYEWAGFVLVE